jgi:hypothetical protein
MTRQLPIDTQIEISYTPGFKKEFLVTSPLSLPFVIEGCLDKGELPVNRTG